MAQYAGICKEGDTNKGLTAAARDATTINALNVVSIWKLAFIVPP